VKYIECEFKHGMPKNLMKINNV